MIRFFRKIKDLLFGTCVSCQFATTENCDGEIDYIRCKKQRCYHCDHYRFVDIDYKCKNYKRKNKKEI
jgi:hypothetical protein